MENLNQDTSYLLHLGNLLLVIMLVGHPHLGLKHPAAAVDMAARSRVNRCASRRQGGSAYSALGASNHLEVPAARSTYYTCSGSNGWCANPYHLAPSASRVQTQPHPSVQGVPPQLAATHPSKSFQCSADASRHSSAAAASMPELWVRYATAACSFSGGRPCGSWSVVVLVRAGARDAASLPATTNSSSSSSSSSPQAPCLGWQSGGGAPTSG